MRSVVNLVLATNGAFGYGEVMKMEIAEFNNVYKEVQIVRSAEKFEQQRADNHAKAVR